MRKMQTKYSKEECEAFESFMIEIGQWKRHNGSIVQVGEFRTQEDIERMWKARLKKLEEAEKAKNKPTKVKTIYRKTIH